MLLKDTFNTVRKTSTTVFSCCSLLLWYKLLICVFSFCFLLLGFVFVEERLSCCCRGYKNTGIQSSKTFRYIKALGSFTKYVYAMGIF